MAPKFLPEGTVLTYFAEGAANVVYTIRPPTDTSSVGRPDIESGEAIESYSANTPPPTEVEASEVDISGDADYTFFQGKLLRLRKDVPDVVSVLEAQKGYEEEIVPLVPDAYLIHQELVSIPRQTYERLDGELRDMEAKGRRSTKRRGQFLKRDDYGLLVTDMSSANRDNCVTVELKPKWLSQSRSAPPNARRCRTCALGALRKSAGDSQNVICPLDLVSGKRDDVESLVRRVLIKKHRDSSKDFEGLVQHLADFLVQCPLLSTLRDVQNNLDKGGPLDADAEGKGFRIAMTLRDCTLFLRVCLDPYWQTEARIGDLDLKSASKAKSWRSKENELINGGWYADQATPVEKNEVSCFMQRYNAM